MMMRLLTSYKSEVKDDEDNEGWVKDGQTNQKSENDCFQWKFSEENIWYVWKPVEEVRCHLRGGEDDDWDQVARESKKPQ